MSVNLTVTSSPSITLGITKSDGANVALTESNSPSLTVVMSGPAGPTGAGLPSGGLEGQILAKATDISYDTEWIDNFSTSLASTVRNETNSTLTKGTVVYISGASGNKPLVSKASAATEAMSSKTFAILAEDIPHNQNGQAIAAGLLKGVNTLGYTEGANIWLSTTAGLFTQTMPTAPNNAVFLGNVIRAHQTQGEIEVRIQNGYELGELHNVSVAGVTGGEVLRYNASTSLWEDVSATEYTVANTVVARDSTGGTALDNISVGTFTGGSPVGSYGSLDTSDSGYLGMIVSGSPALKLQGTTVDAEGQLKVAGGTLTTSKPVDITQTWNSAGVTFTGIKFNAQGSSNTNSAAASLLMDLQVGGVSKLSMSKGSLLKAASSWSLEQMAGSLGIGCPSGGNGAVFYPQGGSYVNGYLNISSANGAVVPSNRAFCWSNNTDVFSSPDLYLYRDAANQLAQRNGTNAQTFRVYGTYTGSTNFERLNIGYNATATAYQIGTEKGSAGGTARPLEFQTDGVTRLTVSSTGQISVQSSLLLSDLRFPDGGTIRDSSGNTLTIVRPWAAALYYQPIAPVVDKHTYCGMPDRYWSTVHTYAVDLKEQATDPANPAEGKSVIWQSDGTGAGDDGDIMIKITAGGVTKTSTLVDFSAI